MKNVPNLEIKTPTETDQFWKKSYFYYSDMKSIFENDLFKYHIFAMSSWCAFSAHYARALCNVVVNFY